MNKDWYSPGSFMPEDSPAKLGHDQIEWIVEYYEVLNEGRWPPKTSGYIENPFAPPSSQIKARASFETPMVVMAEFHWRVEQCGDDGETFLCIKCLKYNAERISRIMRVRESDIDRILAMVFDYIAGRRKSRPYTEFIRHYSPGYRGTPRYK